MGMNPWFSSQLNSARAVDMERAAAQAHLALEAKRSAGPAPRGPHRMRRVVSRRVGALLMTAGARLAGPELAHRHLRDV